MAETLTQKLDRRLAEVLAMRKNELNKIAQAKAEQEKKQEEAEILNQQQEISNKQQQSLIAANIYAESTHESAIEPAKEQQELVLPIVSKSKTLPHKHFSKEFIDFSISAHEEAAQQVQTLATAIAEIFVNDSETAAIVEAHGGREAFAEQYTADVVANFRQAPRYDQANNAQLNELEQTYNSFINRIEGALVKRKSNNSRNDIITILNQVFVQDPAPEQQPQSSIVSAMTPKPSFSSTNKAKEEEEEKANAYTYNHKLKLISICGTSDSYGISLLSTFSALASTPQAREASLISSLISSGAPVQKIYPNQAVLFPWEQRNQQVLEQVRSAFLSTPNPFS